MIWTNEVEDLLERLRLNCVNLSEYHRRRYFHFKSYSKYFRIPLIVLASLNATASVGLQPYVQQEFISAFTCAIGMTIGIIGSVELYLGVESSQELEFTQSKAFYTLAIEIYKMSCLSREQREVSGKDYLCEQYSRYIKLNEASNLLVRRMRPDLLTEPRDGFSYLKNNNSASSSGSQTPPALELRPFGIRRSADWPIINNPNISPEAIEEEI